MSGSSGHGGETGSVVGHGRVARMLHWTTVALLAVTVPAGIAMTSQGFRAQSDALYVLHKGLGVVLLVVVTLRLAWRLAVRPPPLPDSVPSGERRAAAFTHALLLGLLMAMALTGYVRTVGDGYPIEWLDALGVPPLVGRMPDLARRLSVAHKMLAYVTIALVAVHVSAVLRHAFVARDGTLRRMWPPWGGSRGHTPGPDGGAGGAG